MEAVSYTHLDVYKRQAYDFQPVFIAGGIRIPEIQEDQYFVFAFDNFRSSILDIEWNLICPGKNTDSLCAPSDAA